MAMATIDTNGDATYDFITPAAFEYQDDALMKLLSPHDNESNDAPLDYDDDTRITISSTTSNNLVCIMGTMAARLSDGDSYKTIHRIRNEAQEGTVVLDVNLRSPWYTPQKVLELARGSGGGNNNCNTTNYRKLALLKLNEDELCILEQWCGLKVDQYDDEAVLYTLLMTGSALERCMERLNKFCTHNVCV